MGRRKDQLTGVLFDERGPVQPGHCPACRRPIGTPDFGCTELGLHSQTAPYQPHSEPSRAAAASVEQGMNELQERVLAALKMRGGLTDEEGIDYTGLSPNTYRPRRVELRDAGRIHEDGKRVGRSGRLATVWRIA